jgi:gas vesicle protein
MRQACFPRHAGVVLAVMIGLQTWLLAPRGVMAGPSTVKEMGRDMEAAAQAVKRSTIQERDKAMARGKETLDYLDAQLEEVQGRMDRNWDRMSAEARREARASLEALQRQRRQVSEWYGGLRHSSAEAWEEVKQGFMESYRSFQENLQTAQDRF